MQQMHSCLARDLPTTEDITQTFKDCFNEVDATLRVDRHINTNEGGTTCTMMLYDRAANTVSTAWVGDTRSVIGRRDALGCRPVDITTDHKPDVETEKKRIERAGGVLQEAGEEGLSATVWLPDESQGLAMSRSLGDSLFHRVGVTSDPEVVVRELGDYDEFIIIASDGVWEMLTSEEAVAIVHNCRAKNATQACVDLIHAATAKWQVMEGAYRDDITAIVAFLRPLQQHLTGGSLLEGSSSLIDSSQAVPDATPGDGRSAPPGPNFARRRSLQGSEVKLPAPVPAKGRRPSLSVAPDMDLAGNLLQPGPPNQTSPQ